jgi:transcriptional regulator with XRE-family HTH domain
MWGYYTRLCEKSIHQIRDIVPFHIRDGHPTKRGMLMRGIYLEVLTTAKEQKHLSYEKIYQRTGISVPKLQCIFTGQRTFTVDDFELICEKGLELDLDEIYARFGRQEFRDSQDVGFKGAKELLSDFGKQKEALRTQYEERVQREREAVDFLKKLLDEAKAYNAKLTERAVKAETESAQAHKTSRRILTISVILVVMFAALLVLGIVMDLPHLGMGNCSYLH